MERRVIEFLDGWKNNRLVVLLTCVKWKTLTFYLDFKLWLRLECAFCLVLVVRGQCTEDGPVAQWCPRGTTCSWHHYCSESCLKKVQGICVDAHFCAAATQRSTASVQGDTHIILWEPGLEGGPATKSWWSGESGRLMRHWKKGWSGVLLSWNRQKTRFRIRNMPCFLTCC